MYSIYIYTHIYIERTIMVLTEHNQGLFAGTRVTMNQLKPPDSCAA